MVLIKLLTLDIETTPNLAHVWQLWGQHNVGLNQLMESSELLCAAYKWYGEDKTHFIFGPSYDHLPGEAGALENLYVAVCEADAIITYNGKKFDMPRLNSAFIEQGFDVPAPYQQIDLYQTVKRVFGWPSKLSKKFVALNCSCRLKYDAEAWKSRVPDLVMTFTFEPAFRPYSA